MMKLKVLLAATAGCFVSIAPQALAQNSIQSIQLFGPVNVRPSASTTSFSNPAIFNSNTLSLSCPSSPSAVLSSTADSTGNLLVDNIINVTVMLDGVTTGPTNVCTGGVVGGIPGGGPSCFSTAYQGPASEGNLNGVDPDTLLPAGGVGPIDISSLLTSGSQQVKIDLVDYGGWLASSTLYLNTNCASGGVSAPATISGNTISSANPTTLNQSFTFNPLANNGISFQYDLTTAQNAGTLSIDPNGPIPSAGDMSLDPTIWQAVWAPGTSFATSNCFVHDGEILADGKTPGCKLYTLTCTIGTGSDAKGINCPVSTDPNEAINDVFDGPAVTLSDHQGMGFLMASEPWTGGACEFATGSGFENSTCPQNVLSTFSGPGTFTNNATITHPNSTFITIWGIPEDLTTVTVAGMQPGNWVKTQSPSVTFSAQPPSAPGNASFVPSPIQSITYGISTADNVPTPGAPVAGDTTLTNAIECPLPAHPTIPPATTFVTNANPPISVEADGHYALHYFAQDCAGTKELKFTNSGGSWSTNFYTFPINVDTAPPAVASGPTLSPAGPYSPGQTGVTATFRCTDSLSGVVMCGSQSFPAGTLNTNNVTVPVPISTTPGSYTFSVVAIDAAGNQSPTASTPYTVQQPASDGQVVVTLASGTVTYPLGTNLEVQVSKINSHVPTGTVKIVDNGTTLLTTLSLNNAGDAFFYVKNLSAGMHSLTAVYSGDKFNPGGTSAPATLNVLPVPVTLSVTCWNTPFPVGSNFQCNVHATSTAGAAPGSITYVYDTNPPASAALSSGAALIVIPKPPIGNHSIVISYPGAPNFAAAGPQTVKFTVTAH